MADITTKYKSKWTGAEIDAKLSEQTNPNLLINPHFANPVNQRGITSGTTTNGQYGLDSWKFRQNGNSFEVTDEGFALAPGSVSNAVIEQLFEKPEVFHGQKMTMSLLTADGELQYGTITRQHGTTQHFVTQSGNVQLTFINTNSVFIRLYAVKTLVFAKLELGEQQTLAHKDADGNWVLNEIPDFGSEQLKCQRYYQLFSSEAARPAALADYRPSMRVTPATGTIDIDGVTYYYADANP